MAVEENGIGAEEKAVESPKASFNLCKMSKRNIVILISAFSLYVLTGIAYSLLAPFFPLEAKEKGMSATMIGLVFSVFELVMFFASPVYGYYMTFLGPEFVLKCAVAIGGVVSILFGTLYLAPDGAAFIACCFVVRIVESFGFSAIWVAGFTVLSALYPGYAGVMISVQQTCFSIGLMVGPVIGGVLYEVGGFGLPFYFAGAVVLINGTVLAITLPPSPPPPPQATSVSKLKVLKSPLVWFGVMNTFIGAVAYTSVEPSLSLHLKKTLNMNAAEIGLMFIVAPISLAVAGPVQGYLVDKLGLHYIVMVVDGFLCFLNQVLLGPTPFLPFLHLSIALVVISMFCLGFGCSFVAHTKCALIGAMEQGCENNSDTMAVISSLMVSFFCLGGVVGTFFGGFLPEKMGYEYATTVFAGICLITTVVTVVYLCGRTGIMTKPCRSLGDGERIKLVQNGNKSRDCPEH